MTITQVMVPLAGALAVLIVISYGSDETRERAFRLPRWAVNRPEPPAPDHTCHHHRQAPADEGWELIDQFLPAAETTRDPAASPGHSSSGGVAGYADGLTPSTW